MVKNNSTQKEKKSTKSKSKVNKLNNKKDSKKIPIILVMEKMPMIKVRMMEGMYLYSLIDLQIWGSKCYT